MQRSRAECDAGKRSAAISSVVVLKAKVGDKFLAPQVTEGVFQFHQLDKEIVFGIETRHGHGRFEVEAEPLLNATTAQF
jgi:hypothetical protein